eukprot:TRINITY_DN6178_c0_g1_i3.p1 TRINITY_DN6178_c0_g1~~TRINITY_DN6178_c0_g1_i3.p1  ORF type:complete len:330 (-),score=29.08 TRINITY_DN6178_c0_g1_i3:126-1115(-)
MLGHPAPRPMFNAGGHCGPFDPWMAHAEQRNSLPVGRHPVSFDDYDDESLASVDEDLHEMLPRAGRYVMSVPHPHMHMVPPPPHLHRPVSGPLHPRFGAAHPAAFSHVPTMLDRRSAGQSTASLFPGSTHPGTGSGCGGGNNHIASPPGTFRGCLGNGMERSVVQDLSRPPQSHFVPRPPLLPPQQHLLPPRGLQPPQLARNTPPHLQQALPQHASMKAPVPEPQRWEPHTMAFPGRSPHASPFLGSRATVPCRPPPGHGGYPPFPIPRPPFPPPVQQGHWPEPHGHDWEDVEEKSTMQGLIEDLLALQLEQRRDQLEETRIARMRGWN